MERQEKNNAIGSKLRTTFAVFVIFVLMAAVAVVFLGIEMPVNQQQQQQQDSEENLRQQQDSDVTPSSSLPISKLTRLVEEEPESQDSSFLEKSTIVNRSQGIEKEKEESNPFSDVSCDQLADIASSFEDEWGSALVEFSTRCEMDNGMKIE